MALDAVKEKEISLGWEYPFGELKEFECILSKKLADSLELIVGDSVIIYGDYYDFYSASYMQYYFEKIGYHFNISTYNETFLNE